MIPQFPDAIDLDRAIAIFAEFAAARYLTLQFPQDGCYARTHVMVQRLFDKGLAPNKIWAFASSAADPLWMEARRIPNVRVQWGYHVAPTLMVYGLDDEMREMVFDPVLFDQPMLVDCCLTALHDTPYSVRTVFSEPPLPVRGGSGYWPGPDPIEGANLHARETLEEYGRDNE